mmetsp:Transcript_11557/g.10228  ORF Transcript_11557/g.10228 Transcript_11557/m.10228 type:complete len:374 (+) Transcript_11557:1180-2301(+)
MEIYIENLNSHLRSLSFFEFLNFSESKFWALIRFLHSNNQGILKKRSIKAELAVLEYLNKGSKTVKLAKSSTRKSKNETSQTYIFHFDFISKFPHTVRNIVDYCRYELYKNKKDIKLAIVFSRMDQSTIMPQHVHPEIQAVSPKSGYRSTSQIDKYNGSNNMTVSSVPKFHQSPEHSEEEDSEVEIYDEPDKLFAGLKSNWAEPKIIKGNESKHLETNKDSFSASGSIYSQASYRPNKIEVESYDDDEHLVRMLLDEHPLTGFKNRRHGRDCCFRFKISIVAFLKFAFLRSSLPPKYPLLNIGIMIMLLFTDIASSLMLVLLYEHEAQFQITLIPYLFIYPFTIVLSPLAALASIFICKSSFYRIFMNLNALS